LTVDVCEQRIITNAASPQVLILTKLVGVKVVGNPLDFGFSEFGTNRMLDEPSLGFRKGCRRISS
jgi:hypothetical protein